MSGLPKKKSKASWIQGKCDEQISYFDFLLSRHRLAFVLISAYLSVLHRVLFPVGSYFPNSKPRYHTLSYSSRGKIIRYTCQWRCPHVSSCGQQPRSCPPSTVFNQCRSCNVTGNLVKENREFVTPYSNFHASLIRLNSCTPFWSTQLPKAFFALLNSTIFKEQLVYITEYVSGKF